MTRPLVIRPDLLTPEEEDHFLPHVFNNLLAEARSDYIDLHGSRITINNGNSESVPALNTTIDSLTRVATRLELAEGWLFELGTSIRIYASVMRSLRNFYLGQLIRDAHTTELAAAPRQPSKEPCMEGEGRILQWNQLMRDEMENAQELIALLESRGLRQLAHAADAQDQDTFVLGPDVIGDIKKKVQVMRHHWLDVQNYLAPPNK
jgi:hypothetical protein